MEVTTTAAVCCKLKDASTNYCSPLDERKCYTTSQRATTRPVLPGMVHFLPQCKAV